MTEQRSLRRSHLAKAVPPPHRNGDPEVDSNTDRVIYTIKEAGIRLGVGRTLMYELVMSGAIRSVTIGRLRRVPAQCIDEYITQLLEQPADLPNAA
jgi:excisionase family DNA binding protein